MLISETRPTALTRFLRGKKELLLFESKKERIKKKGKIEQEEMSESP